MCLTPSSHKSVKVWKIRLLHGHSVCPKQILYKNGNRNCQILKFQVYNKFEIILLNFFKYLQSYRKTISLPPPNLTCSYTWLIGWHLFLEHPVHIMCILLDGMKRFEYVVASLFNTNMIVDIKGFAAFQWRRVACDRLTLACTSGGRNTSPTVGSYNRGSDALKQRWWRVSPSYSLKAYFDVTTSSISLLFDTKLGALQKNIKTLNFKVTILVDYLSQQRLK